MVVLGIDPATRVSGYVIFKKEDRRLFVLDYGTLSLPATASLPDRVASFYTFFQEKITTFGVTHLAVETPFLGKNASNFLKLGYLRGAAYILVSQHKLVLHEVSPREVKLAVTGYGAADKEQVARVIVRLFPGLVMPKTYDMTDAFGVGMCCVWSAQSAERYAEAVGR